MPGFFNRMYLNGMYNLDEILVICLDFYGYTEFRNYILTSVPVSSFNGEIEK